MNKQKKKYLIFGIGVMLFAFPFFVSADVLGDQQRFSVDEEYDIAERQEVEAVLQVANSTVYLYVERPWWNNLSSTEQEEGKEALIALAQEFEQNAYPILTQTFGTEWKPGIDEDPIITVLMHEMREDAGGYTNYGDEFLRLQNPRSNEREMIYLNVKNLESPLLKSFLAHEFVHLITFNQKDRLKDTTEEVWLNEVRAEYAPTLLGYDLSYETSMIKQRVQNFLGDTTDSLSEWLNTTADYGTANLFSQYLVNQYGVQVLVDSLKSRQIGIASLNEALAAGKFQKTFSEVFSDWMITLFLNDCSYGERYCYHNPHLVNFRVIPQTNFLPGVGNSTLTLNNSTKDWAGNWLKILGGKEVLQIEFQGSSSGLFRVPYILEKLDRTFSVHALELSVEGKGNLEFPNFNKDIRSVTFIPFSKTRSTDLDTPHPLHSFSLVVSVSERTQKEEETLITRLLLQIEVLKAEIAKVKAQLAAVQSMAVNNGTCGTFNNNLFYGIQDNQEVRCLQEFLKSQGDGIYPEGIISGNFLSLTRVAVIRFQERYADDILLPLGFEKGTGYVGSLTREKINFFLNP